MEKIWENDGFKADLEDRIKREARQWVKRKKREEQGIVEMIDM